MSNEIDRERREGLRNFAIAQAAEAAQLRIRIRRLERENTKLRRQLTRIHSSWTWRVGRIVLFPYHAVVSAKERIARGR